jgi:hypothetical protein
MSLSTEFLAPGTCTEPESGPLRRTMMRGDSIFTTLSMLAQCH